MSLIELVAILVTLTAVFAYANYRLLRLPMPIGVMVIAMAMSMLLLAVDHAGFPVADRAVVLIESVHFDDTLLHALLGPLLFAGAMFVNLDDLVAQRGTVLLFATVGVVLSILLVGTALYHVSAWLGVTLPFGWCLLFGALISPTDPIAVLGILRRLGVPNRLQIKFTGESLFNDGVGVVAFLVLLGAVTGEAPGVAEMATLFVLEIGGGVVLGLALGYGVYILLRRVDQYQVEILLSLALVTGGYALAERLHLSAPIFAVVSGLLIGNVGRRLAMSEHTRAHLDTFWELVDELLNALLFVLIGVEVLVLAFPDGAVWLALAAIPLVLAARFIGIGFLVGILRSRRSFSPHVVSLLTWGGLRGGISVALALSLPAGEFRDYLLTMTYVVVAFSIIVQGLTIGPAIRAAGVGGQAPADTSHH